MRNQVFKFNPGSINENKFFRDQFEIIQANYAKSGTNLIKLRVNVQSRVKSHKSEIRDPNKKGTHKARDVFKILTGTQLHKIKSLKLIRGAIETIKY